jgi:hypothetical protein
MWSLNQTSRLLALRGYRYERRFSLLCTLSQMLFFAPEWHPPKDHAFACHRIAKGTWQRLPGSAGKLISRSSPNGFDADSRCFQNNGRALHLVPRNGIRCEASGHCECILNRKWNRLGISSKPFSPTELMYHVQTRFVIQVSWSCVRLSSCA